MLLAKRNFNLFVASFECRRTIDFITIWGTPWSRGMSIVRAMKRRATIFGIKRLCKAGVHLTHNTLFTCIVQLCVSEPRIMQQVLTPFVCKLLLCLSHPFIDLWVSMVQRREVFFNCIGALLFANIQTSVVYALVTVNEAWHRTRCLVFFFQHSSRINSRPSMWIYFFRFIMHVFGRTRQSQSQN